jgi:hypothetical protein
MSSIQAQILRALYFLTSSGGVLAIAAFVLILAMTLLVSQFKYILLILAIAASTLSMETYEVHRTLIFPLEQLRAQGRPLTIALTLLFLIALLRTPDRGSRRKYLIGGSIAFFAYQVAMSSRLIFGGDFARGAPELLIFSLLFLTLGLALARSLQTWNDGLALAGTGILFAVMNVGQFLAHPGSVAPSHRFEGTTGNPQHAAPFCAMLMLPILYLMIRPGRSRFGRIGMIVAFTTLLVMDLWTGSRTGLLMTITGIGLLFRTRIGRLAGTGIIITCLVLLVANVTANLWGSHVISAHLISTENTRAGVWNEMIGDFLSSPVAGQLNHGVFGVGEGSYLATAADFGLLGLIPMAAFLALTFLALIRLQRVRKYLPDSMLADLATAAIAQILVGGIFEGFLVATLVVEQYMVYIYLTLIAFLLEYAELPRLEEETIDQYLTGPGDLLPGI